MNVEEFRQKNPQYDDMSNADLGFGLWNKHYKDDMNAWEFAETFGLNADDVASMRKKGLASGLTEVDIAGDMAKVDKEAGAATVGVSGQTLGLGSEVQAAVTATMEKLQNPDADWSDSYNNNKGYFRGNLERYREEYPMEALGVEVAGAVTSPLGAVKLPGFLSNLPTGLQAMFRGFVEGTVYGVNDSQDKSLAKGLEVGTVSAFMTGGMDKLLRGFKPTSKTVKSLMNLRKNPTVEGLKKAKQAAYKEVDGMGGIFGADDVQSIWKAGDDAILNRIAYDPSVDKVVKSIQKQFGRYIKDNKVFKLSELDNIRKDLFRRQTSANANEKEIIGAMINQIDNVIHKKPIAGPAMKLARDLHGRFMKTKQLDDAFNAARRSADASGSGGNMVNLYKQAVKNILNNPKKHKFFSQVEMDTMEHFVKGGFGEKAMRTLSKASPSGNGLIFVLTVGAATMNPAALTLTAAGMAAKKSLEKGTQRKAGQLIEDIGQAVARPLKPSAPLPGIPTLMSVTAGSPAGLNNPAEGLFDTMEEPQ